MFTLFGNVKGLALFQSDIVGTTSFGPTWHMKVGIRYDAPGGVQFIPPMPSTSPESPKQSTC